LISDPKRALLATIQRLLDSGTTAAAAV